MPRTRRVLTTLAEVRRIAPDWQRLHAATPGATPWQGWPWFEAWWSAMGRGAGLCVVVVEELGRPVLLLPLQVRSARMGGLPVRVLEPVGMPDEINRPRLALGEPHPGRMEVALDTVMAREPGPGGEGTPAWDLLRFDEILPGDPLMAVLQARAERHGLALDVAPLHPCPWLSLDQAWPGYLASRGRRLGRNLRAARRRLAHEGPVALRIATEPAAVQRGLRAFVDVYRRSWKGRAGLGFARADYRAYYARYLEALCRDGAARVLTLHAGGAVVAAALAVTDGPTYYGAQIAHDPAYERASPGTLLEAMEIEGLMEEGRFAAYDFFGAALANKQRWTDDAVATVRVLVFGSSPTAYLVRGYLLHVKPRLARSARKGRAGPGES